MKKNYAILFGIFILSLIIFSCKRDYDKPSNTDEKTIPTDTPSKKYTQINHVTFYIENSGSMFGYVKEPTEYVEVVNKLAQYPNLVKTETHFLYNLISGKKDPKNKEPELEIFKIGDNPHILKSTLTEKGLDRNSSSCSDLNEMFKIALNDAKCDSISMLISDGIYDVGGSTNPINSLQTEVQSTTTNFINRLKKDDIETLLIKLESDFNGFYHPANVTDPKGKSKKIDQKRPYYIWVFGNSDLLKEYFPEERLAELNGYVDLARFRKISKNDFPFEGIGYNNFGFRKDFSASKTFELYHNVTNSNQFTIAVNFSNLNLSNSYLTSTSNYSCSRNYVVKKISTIGTIPKSEIESYTDMLDFKPTHIITIESETSQPEIGNMSITLNNKLPNWINESNTDNDYPFDGSTTQTFGFSTLIKGIEEAYKEVSNTKSLAEFNIIIQN